MSGDSDKLTHKHCPVCSSSVHSWRIKEVDGVHYHFDRCIACGYCFVNPRPTMAFLTAFYTSFGHGDSKSDSGAPTIQAILDQERSDPNSTVDAKRLIKTVQQLFSSVESARLLDVGCGYGFFSRQALEAGFKVTALELAENERIIACNVAGVTPISSSFEAFEGNPESQDVVLMSQILEHALDVNFWVEKSYRLLAPNGVLVIALPNFGSLFRLILQENEPYIHPPAHLNHFNRRSLSKLLEKHGFKVEIVQWSSRIPRRSLAARIPRGMRPVLPMIATSASIVLRLVDALHLGSMLNVYARKVAT